VNADIREITEWRKSRFCQTTCVEVGMSEGLVGIRNSKDPDGPALTFSRAEWKAFISGVHAGDFEIA
jgi:Domain of unknown function (DUF397)